MGTGGRMCAWADLDSDGVVDSVKANEDVGEGVGGARLAVCVHDDWSGGVALQLGLEACGGAELTAELFSQLAIGGRYEADICEPLAHICENLGKGVGCEPNLSLPWR
jgi:hypothetical protein